MVPAFASYAGKGGILRLRDIIGEQPLNLQVIIVSTRPGRAGGAVGAWFHELARKHGKFDVELVDLAEVALPLFDEAKHPRLAEYEHEHTKRWSETVSRADAYIFVTPEYNYSTPPSLVNALTYLVREWAYKPAGFVSYGGVSGGTRGVQMTKQTLTALKMMPMSEAVAIPFFTQYLDSATGIFAPGEKQERAGTVLLDELFRWGEALKTLRG
jgi:NAD(P)H-dependent FMN reductase